MSLDDSLLPTVYDLSDVESGSNNSPCSKCSGCSLSSGSVSRLLSQLCYGTQDDSKSKCVVDFTFSDLSIPLHEAVVNKTSLYQCQCSNVSLPKLGSPCTQATEEESIASHEEEEGPKQTLDLHDLPCFNDSASFHSEEEIQCRPNQNDDFNEDDYDYLKKWKDRFAGAVLEPMESATTAKGVDVESVDHGEEDILNASPAVAEKTRGGYCSSSPLFNCLVPFQGLLREMTCGGGDEDYGEKIGRNPAAAEVSMEDNVSRPKKSPSAAMAMEDTSPGALMEMTDSSPNAVMAMEETLPNTVMASEECTLSQWKKSPSIDISEREINAPSGLVTSKTKKSSFFRKSLRRGQSKGDPFICEDFLFEEVYDLTQQILRGSLSVLWECVNRCTSQVFLTKIFTWNGPAELKLVKHEVSILLRIQGIPCVVKVVHIFESEQTIHVVLEKPPSPGALSLQSLVLREGCMTESMLRPVIRNLLLSMDQLHKVGISCNQVLPSQILVISDPLSVYHDLPATLVDFGAATIHINNTTADAAGGGTKSFWGNGEEDAIEMFKVHRQMQRAIADRLESPAYAPPELSQKLSPLETGGSCLDHDDESFYFSCSDSWSASDAWSIGVLMYYCLMGHMPPFLGDLRGRWNEESGREQQQQQQRGHPTRHSDSILYMGNGVQDHVHSLDDNCSDRGWVNYHLDHHNDGSTTNRLSRHAKHFVSACLQQDPAERMTIPDALEHPWMQISNLSEKHSAPWMMMMMESGGGGRACSAVAAVLHHRKTATWIDWWISLQQLRERWNKQRLGYLPVES